MTSALPSLAGHRITAVEPLEIRSRYPRPIGRNARLGAHGEGPAARAYMVRTDSGFTGWGMDEGPPGTPELLVGRPLEEVFNPGTGILDPLARPVDVALHDLAARILEVPVHAMIGGLGSTEVPCYSGAIYFDDLDPEDAPRGIEGVLAGCAADHAAGYRAFKLKIGRGNRWMETEEGFARDLAVVRAVRAAYPAARLLVDMNDGYDPARTLRFLDETADLDLYWIEEPFAEHAEGLRRVREHREAIRSQVLVADGEFDPDVEEVLALTREGLLDVLLMDVLSFGITAWRRCLPEVVAAGALASPHAWGHPLKSLYAAQLAAGLGGVEVVEGVPGTTDGVDTSAYRLQEGRILVPDLPGFGIAPPAV
ncbi:enolase C-terminal domain-like protein [Brachybacterium sp. YJGR34]|uniref:enolase C-terminal domain-like protein n=1 Tax=Brachybacterium sp. YJGR34 TaxID=2059911 RepID=UPI000E09FAAD|nr:enolase C-terminal domain-like protein [Brachybacterium sp. YJGR34]